MFPKKRADKLVVEELPDETLVYDLVSHKAHCLNELASVIWKHCDGETSPRDLGRIASQALGTPISVTVVTAALAHLEYANLLKADLGTHRSVRRISRRELARNLAAAGIAATVVTVTSPHAAQAATGLQCCIDSGPCPPGQNCVSRPICAPCLPNKCCQPP